MDVDRARVAVGARRPRCRVSSMSRVNTRARGGAPARRGSRTRRRSAGRPSPRTRTRACPESIRSSAGRAAPRRPSARLARDRGAPQRGLHAAAELAHREGLGDVVVGAELEADDLVDLLGLAVSMMIGTVLRARSRRQTSSPSSLGIITSSTTRSKLPSPKRLSASPPVAGEDDLVAVLAQREARAVSGSTPRRRPGGSEADGRPCRALRLGLDRWRIRRSVQAPTTVPSRRCSTRASTGPHCCPSCSSLIVVAFSLEDRPGPLRTSFAPDAFDGERAARTARRARARRTPRGVPGAPATRRSARPSRAAAMRAAAARRVRYAHATRARRSTATATLRHRHALSGPGARRARRSCVVAHRDSARRGSEGRPVGHRGAARARERDRWRSRAARSITFVSTSGRSGGQAGMRELRRSPARARRRGDRARRPRLATRAWRSQPLGRRLVGRARARASVRLQRTASARRAPRGGRRARVRRAHAPSSRATRCRWRSPSRASRSSAGLPAVRLSLGGELPLRRRHAQVTAERLRDLRAGGAAHARRARRAASAAGGPTRDLGCRAQDPPRLGCAAARRGAAAAGDADGRRRLSHGCAAGGGPLAGAVVWVLGLALAVRRCGRCWPARWL